MTTNTRVKSLKFTVDEWQAVEKAAEAAHLSTHAWIRIVVNAALGSALPEQLERLVPGAVIVVPGPDEITTRGITAKEFHDNCVRATRALRKERRTG